MKRGYHLLEIANVHGGDFNYFKELVENISKYEKPNYGVKFQVFKYDLIALSSYSDFKIYEELFFSWKEWEELITLANKSKDVWIDIFDLYGVEAVERFQSMVYGVKFQASVLDNLEVFEALGKIDMTDKYLILNIAGLTITEIEEKIEIIKDKILCKEILLQVGFQSYPTPIEKSAIFKIKDIADLGYKVIYADHSNGDQEEAIWLPIMALHSGAYGIEKHIMLATRHTKYDFQASLDLDRLSMYIEQLNKYYVSLDRSFINDLEEKYLLKTIQKPIVNKTLQKGKTPSLGDFYFRRTDDDGLTFEEIQSLISEGYVLRNTVEKNRGLKKEDFKKPIVAVIVACRLKSTRLKNKALENIGDITSIEMCMKNILKIKEAQHVILATSDLESDAALKDYTYHDSVIFHKGDPEDVIRRYLDICDILGIDTVVRITGDCPYVSNEIVSTLYESHRKSGADYTAAKEFAVGTSAEIIEVSAMRKIKEHFTSAAYSEYMTWYFMNNPEHFKLNVVELPKDMVRDYRLTLDFQEDLDLFNHIEKHFFDTRKEFTLESMFNFLDENPDIASVNSNRVLKYKTDQELINTLNRETKIR